MESYTGLGNTCLIDKCFSAGKSFKRVTDSNILEEVRNFDDKIKLNKIWTKFDL